MNRKIPLSILALTAVLGVAEYVIFTDYILFAIVSIQGLTGVFSGGSAPLPSPSAATAPDIGWITVFGHHTHALVLLPAIFVLWLLAIRRWSNDGVDITVLAALGGTLMLVGISLPGFASSAAVQPTRFYRFAAIFVAIFLGVWVTDASTSRSRRIVVAGFLIGVLVLQSFALAGSIAPPGQPRYYLTAEETAGKQFVQANVERPIYTDDYYAREIVYPEDVEGLEKIELGGQISTHPFRVIGPEFYNGTIQEVDTIALRTNEDVFRPLPGTFRDSYYDLDYSPEEKLQTSHSKVYSNGGVSIYTNQTEG